MKDNWTWIIGTLILRFVGVFVVLLFLLIGMYVSGWIISRSIGKIDGKGTPAKA
jgi:Na+-transporting methylmalonyl-CoA/oxaloacetate decarboxylase gamma subunit